MKFPLGTVLSVTTGRLLSPDGIGGVYAILSHMTGDTLYTHQLPRALDACAGPLLAQHPDLAGVHVEAGRLTPSDIDVLMVDLRARYGDEREVAPLRPHVWEHREPISELAERVHPSKIVVVG